MTRHTDCPVNDRQSPSRPHDVGDAGLQMLLHIPPGQAVASVNHIHGGAQLVAEHAAPRRPPPAPRSVSATAKSLPPTAKSGAVAKR